MYALVVTCIGIAIIATTAVSVACFSIWSDRRHR